MTKKVIDWLDNNVFGVLNHPHPFIFIVEEVYIYS
jgi:hypothetical protein